MTDYERLTRYMQVGNKVVQVIPQRKERIQAYIDRLFDLEDKIESSELISKKEVERLQNENAALRERLEKAAELKVKPGDKVYCIHGMSDPIIIEWQVDEIRITDHNYILQLIIAGTKDYRNELSQYYGKWWFTTREAAEARLKELQGGEE